MKYILLISGLFLSFLYSNDNIKIDATFTYSPLSLDGYQRLGNDESSSVRSFSSFGINDYQHTILPQINLVYKKKHKFLFSYLPTKYNGSKTLTKSIDINITKNDDNYYIGDTVKTTMQSDWATAGYRYGKDNIKVGFDIIYYSYNITLETQDKVTPINNSYIFPTMNIDITTKFDKFNMIYNAALGDNSESTYFNFILGGGYDIESVKKSNISFGYKISEFYLYDGTYETFHRYEGPFIKYNIKF